MSETTEAPSMEKETLSSSVMYVDRVRSEMMLKLETIYWQLEYLNIEDGKAYIRYDATMGTMHYSKMEECVTIFLYPNFSCKTSIQCFLVYKLDVDNMKCSDAVFAENLGGRKRKIEIPPALIHHKSNEYLKKSGCIVLGIRYNSRRLMNTEVGIFLLGSSKTDSFLDAYWNRRFTDFIIHAGGKEFHVHKAILSARSIYFLRKVPSTQNEIFLDATPTTVQHIIIFLYAGKLLPITLDEIIKVFDVSVIWYIPSLLDLCVVYLLDILNVENVEKIRKAAERTRNGLLIKAVNGMTFNKHI